MCCMSVEGKYIYSILFYSILINKRSPVLSIFYHCTFKLVSLKLRMGLKIEGKNDAPYGKSGGNQKILKHENFFHGVGETFTPWI
jgi:hypothetical protein